MLFKDLRVVGLGSAASFQPTFGSTFNPKVMLESLNNIRNPPLRDILSGFEGVVRPGEMLRTSVLQPLLPISDLPPQSSLEALAPDAARCSRHSLISGTSIILLRAMSTTTRLLRRRLPTATAAMSSTALRMMCTSP